MTVLEDNAIRLQMEKDGKVIENIPTLRDQFAMQFMNGWCSNLAGGFKDFDSEYAEKLAAISYTFADAMLEARKEK